MTDEPKLPELSPNDLDELMDRDPLLLSAQDIDQIIWHDPDSYYVIRAKEILCRATIEGECWICHYAPSKVGYPKIGSDTYAHVFICETVHGPIIDGKYAMHSCDNKRCINPKHIHAAWPHENNQDKIDKGLAGNVGGAKPRSFTEADRNKMQQLFWDGWSQRRIAIHFKTSQATVSNYINGR